MEAEYPCELHGHATIEGQAVRWTRSLNTPASRSNEKKKRATELWEHAAGWRRSAEQGEERTLPVLVRYSASRFGPRLRTYGGDEEAPIPGSEPRIDLLSALDTRTSRLDAYANALAPKESWAPIRRWWVREESEASLRERDSPRIDGVAAAVGTVLEISEPPRIDLDIADLLIPISASGEERWVPIAQLSDGYRAVLGLVVDLARRAAQLNPHLGAEAATRSPGIVLIDEIDLHLHPAWQRRMLARLHVAFPQMQFIVTTHSPAVVVGAGAELADVHILEPDPENGPQAVARSYTSGLDIDQVMTGEWFKLGTAVDDATLQLLERYSELFQEPGDQRSPEENEEFERLGEQLQERRLLAGSSVEHLVLDVLKALQREGQDFKDMSWAELEALRKRAVAALLRKSGTVE